MHIHIHIHIQMHIHIHMHIHMHMHMHIHIPVTLRYTHGVLRIAYDVLLDKYLPLTVPIPKSNKGRPMGAASRCSLHECLPEFVAELAGYSTD